MSEEAAVMEKPVRPGGEGRRKRTQEAELVGEAWGGEEGRNGPALQELESLWTDLTHVSIPPAPTILYHPPPFTIHPSIYPSVCIQPYSHPTH